MINLKGIIKLKPKMIGIIKAIKLQPEYEELYIVPSAEEQVKEGSFNKVTVAGTGVTAKITDASYLFTRGARVDEIEAVISLCEKITTMNYMFSYCNKTNFKTVDLSKLDTSNVSSMEYVFFNCSYLTDLDLSNFNTNNVTSMSSMFSSCGNLTDLDLSSFNMEKVINIADVFSSCKNLINLKSFKNLGKGYTRKSNNYTGYKLVLSSSTNLTQESLIDIITNGLYDLNLTYDVANGGTLYRQSLILGSTNLAKLQATEEGQQAITLATNKGWDVS